VTVGLKHEDATSIRASAIAREYFEPRGLKSSREEQALLSIDGQLPFAE